MGLEHGLANPLRPTVAGERLERAREGRLRGNLPERLPAAQPAQGRAMAHRADQVAGGFTISSPIRNAVDDSVSNPAFAQIASCFCAMVYINYLLGK